MCTETSEHQFLSTSLSSLNLKKGKRQQLRAFENKVLWRIFGRTRVISEGWRKLTNNINVKINKIEKGGHAAELKIQIYAKYFNQKS